MSCLTRFALFALLLSCPGYASAQTADVGRGVVRGVVLDRAGGTPLADVSIQVQGTDTRAETDASGRFELRSVVPGRRTLHVSIVGFILVKRDVDVTPESPLDLTIALTEGAGTYSETVTVAGNRFHEQEPAVPAQQTLGSGDIQHLRSLLTNDPMRTVQVLPGVTAGDDFRSEFAVRGSPFRQIGVTLDGIASPFLLHTVQQVADGGSIAMVNGDVLSGISLMNGSYPQRFGNRLGAEMGFSMREGSRERTQVRTGVSGTDSSVVVEGPLAGRSGSWLLSVRRSYLDLLLEQIDSASDFGFGFADAQSKLVYDATPAHRLELTAVAGRSRLDRAVDPGDVNDVKDARNAGQLVNVGWRFIASPATLVTQRVAVATNQFRNTGPTRFLLDRGAGRDLTWRADLIQGLGAGFTFEAGGQLQWQEREHESRRFAGTGIADRVLQDYDASALLSSGYALARWKPAAGVMLSPGARIDAWSLTGDRTVSPWLQGELAVTPTIALRGGVGVHHQFPDVASVRGLRAGSALTPERAHHADLGIEHRIGESMRWQVTLYNREDRDVLRLHGTEPRLVNGRLLLPTTTTRWMNALDGYARGIELLVQRRSTTGLSGWVSYSYGVNRYRDRVTSEAFDGDFDQRHTLNVHASYRVSNRTTLGAKLRAGSNTPAWGYWERTDGGYFVSATRNALRVPSYQRLDVRGSRTFDYQRARLTLFVELLNALGHDNRRFEAPPVNRRTGQAFNPFEPTIPRVPSAGLLLEF